MFSSNQVKQEEYLKLRAQEEDNNRKHQRRLYKKLAQEQGEETTGTNLARLAERVAGKFGDKGGPPITKRGNEPGATFGAFLKKLLGLTPKGLSKKAQIILKDLNTPEWKKSFNDYMAEFLSNIKQTQPDLSAPEVQAVVDAEAEKVVFGGDNTVKKELIEKTLKRSSSESTKLPPSSKKVKLDDRSTEFEKLTKDLKKYEDVINAAERSQMGAEDVLSRAIKLKKNNKISSLMSPEIMRPAQERYDMGAEDVLSRLTTLNANQDYALREKFDNVLDGLAPQAKSIADKKLFKYVKTAIENRRLDDVYKETILNNLKNNLANKLQRNLKALLAEKKSKRENESKKAMNDFTKTMLSQTGRTRSESNATTHMSEPAMKFDFRQFNKGRPSVDIAKKYKKMMKITNKPESQRSFKEKKDLSNLRGTLNKDIDVINTMTSMLSKLEG